MSPSLGLGTKSRARARERSASSLPEVQSDPSAGFLGSRHGWVVPALIWVLAAALVTTLFWVLPRAASSRSLGAGVPVLEARVSAAQILLDKANAQLSALLAELDVLEKTLTDLQGQAKSNAADIMRLDKQIKSLRADKRQAEAAAKAAAAAFAEISTRSTMSFGPPMPCSFVYDSVHMTYYCPSH